MTRSSEEDAPGVAGAAAEAEAAKARADFDPALTDDLNTPEALAAVHVW